MVHRFTVELCMEFTGYSKKDQSEYFGRKFLEELVEETFRIPQCPRRVLRGDRPVT